MVNDNSKTHGNQKRDKRPKDLNQLIVRQQGKGVNETSR